MSHRKPDERPYYAFIELTTIAYNKQYALDIGSAQAPELSEKQTRAEKVEVTKGEWVSSKGECLYTDTEIFDVDGEALVGNYNQLEKDARNNLRFELETRGQSVPR